MTIALSPDAQGHLDRYLQQIRTALSGRPAVDAGEVERDVLGHIDAELSGEAQPVPAHRLLAVLDRLGEPREWLPREDAPAARTFAALDAGPGDWRLPLVACGSMVLAIMLIMGPVMLWPLPPVLAAIGFVIARITIGLLDDRGEAVGHRAWLVYPPLLLFYVPILGALAGGPALPLGNLLVDDAVARRQFASFVQGGAAAVPAIVVVVLGCWWMLIGLVAGQLVSGVRAMFRPFAARFERRHALRLALAGLVLALAGIVLLMITSRFVPRLNAQERAMPDAVPVDPIVAVAEAFRTHPLVAVADAHGNEQTHAFRLALIRDPRLAGVFNDVVVEFGTARYQDVMDRFISGEDVPYASLRRAWEDTTQFEFEWDLPVYEDFLRAIRAVNAARPPAQRLRVLLGDPPMDWENIRSTDDYLARMKAVDRDEHAVAVIRREVLAKNRRALVIYGGGHLFRKNAIPNAPDEWARGVVALLERPGTTSVFSIDPETRIPLTPAQANVASWPKPSLALLKGTAIGQLRVTRPAQRLVRFEEQFDAVVYLGQPGEMTMSTMARGHCDDAEYMKMRLARLSLLPPPPGAPAALPELLRRSCAAAQH